MRSHNLIKDRVLANIRSARSHFCRRLGLFAFASVLIFGIAACTDDINLNNIDDPGNIPGLGLPKDMEHAFVVPLSISLDDIDAETREGNTTIGDTMSGANREHIIDFDKDKECFAIFFRDSDPAEGDATEITYDKGKFMCISRLYTHTTLGSGHKIDDGIGEYVVPAIAYLEAVADLGLDPYYYQDQYGNQLNEDQIRQKIEPYFPTKVLVVLNGGRIYEKLLEKLEITIDPVTGKFSTQNEKGYLDEDDFLNFVWLSDYSLIASGQKDGVIGINNHGHYTMTNSAFYGPGQEFKYNETTGKWTIEELKLDEPQWTLQTVRPLNKAMILPAFASNITPDNTAANIYVERMVAKFSAPKFDTEVIGSSRVFRPSQNAESMVIYTWANDGTLRSEKVNWRIHVLGWTINGREKGNYLFKHIRQAWEGKSKGSYKADGYLTNWAISGPSGWNSKDLRRSYWSIDPHYDDDGEKDFYPWQFRGAVDRKNISLEIFDDPEFKEENPVALRYLTFNDVQYWDDNAIYISENTFDPYTQFDRYVDNNIEDNTSNIKNMDGRKNLLVGPHLLVAAELYIENSAAKDDDYMGQFTTVNHLYADRFRRFYTKEIDCFRMFVKEMNHALHAQEQMTFHLYNWGSDIENTNLEDEYVIVPSGDCGLIFDCELGEDYYKKLTDKQQEIYDKLCGFKITETDEEGNETVKSKYHLQPVASMIDDLYNDGIPVSYEATVKDGDGRILFWIPGMVFRNLNDKETRLKVYNKTVDPNLTNSLPWTTNMRKSLIYEWFGPVDHFNQGYMYYAADIPHYIINPTTREGYFGSVRNHWYTFTVTSINSIGTPVSNINQKIIPGNYNYRDQIGVNLNVIPMHSMSTNVDFN